MNLYAKYIGWVYFKTFLVVFLALELFYVGIDLLTNLKDLPSSANLQLLYVGLTSLTAVGYVMPIALILALIISHINMVRSNELVSFYALGVSKNALIMPPFFISLAIALIYVGLNFTPFAYAYDYQKNIARGANFAKSTTDSFLKFEGKFVYIKELNGLDQIANDMRIFDINDMRLVGTTFAKSAKFSQNKWQLSDVNHTKMPSSLALGEVGFERKNLEQTSVLEGFTPKSIVSANTSERANFSIPDAVDFMLTFGAEGLRLDGVKSIFYGLAFAPFFAPFLTLILYYHMPVTGRFFNLAFASFVFVIVTLITWGILFVLSKFSQNGVILPELGIIAPVAILALYGFWLIKSHR